MESGLFFFFSSFDGCNHVIKSGVQHCDPYQTAASIWCWMVLTLVLSFLLSFFTFWYQAMRD